jgi:hypothetical protein
LRKTGRSGRVSRERQIREFVNYRSRTWSVDDLFLDGIRVLKECNTSPEEAKVFKETSLDFAKRGFRSLGVAVREGKGNWQMLGLLPMFDPPR